MSQTLEDQLFGHFCVWPFLHAICSVVGEWLMASYVTVQDMAVSFLVNAGVTIIIPAGAIADGVEQEVYFKVCQDNSILPPLDKDKGRFPLYIIDSCHMSDTFVLIVKHLKMLCRFVNANCLPYFYHLAQSHFPI